MTTSYQLNPNNAKQVGVTSRIQEKGAYPGTFTRAEAIQSKKGTHGIELSFRSNDGETADYLTLWTHSNDGKELYGRKVVDALMTCMKLRQIAPRLGSVKKYDPELREETTVQATIFPELMNRPIGVMLVREEYEKSDGSTGWKLVIVGAFDPVNGTVPVEILENRGPGMLDKMVASLRDRPLRKGSGGDGHDAPRATVGDDDIPF